MNKWVILGSLLFLAAVPRKKSGGAKFGSGLVLEGAGPKVSDWNAWMAWGPQAVVDAVHDGAQNADQILAHIMRRVFPKHTWPPPPKSEYVERWRKMVHGLNRTLREPADDVDDSNVIPLRG